MKIRTTLAAVIVLSGMAVAGVTVTEIQGRHEARDAKGTLIGQFNTHEECVAALPRPTTAGVQRMGTCKDVTHVDMEGNCDDAVKPALETFTVMEETATVYKGPYCAPGETCTTPPDWDVKNFTYTDIGGIRLNDDGSTDVYELVLKPFAECWQWTWTRVPDPTPVADAGEAVEMEIEPGAYDGELEGVTP